MTTKTDFYVGRGHAAEWIGSLQRDCEPDNLLRVPPGRLALTTIDETTYRDAIEDLLVVWPDEELGHGFYPELHGWPWLSATSHRSDWIVAFDPADCAVFVTIGGGVRWRRLDPRAPRQPDSDPLGPPDRDAWLRAPADPPSVPMPLMRDPAPE